MRGAEVGHRHFNFKIVRQNDEGFSTISLVSDDGANVLRLKACIPSASDEVCRAADYLNDEETIAEYITAALEDSNPDVFLTAVRDVARARGMAQLAKDAGLGRESLYKALTPGAKPRYDTMLKLLHALGVKLSASPVHS